MSEICYRTYCVALEVTGIINAHYKVWCSSHVHTRWEFISFEGPKSKSSLQRWAMIPAAKPSPRTLIIVRKRSLKNQTEEVVYIVAWHLIPPLLNPTINAVVSRQAIVLTRPNRWPRWEWCQRAAAPQRSERSPWLQGRPEEFQQPRYWLLLLWYCSTTTRMWIIANHATTWKKERNK